MQICVYWVKEFLAKLIFACIPAFGFVRLLTVRRKLMATQFLHRLYTIFSYLFILKFNFIQDGFRLTFFFPFFNIWFSSFTFPGLPYRILLPHLSHDSLPFLSCCHQTQYYSVFSLHFTFYLFMYMYKIFMYIHIFLMYMHLYISILYFFRFSYFSHSLIYFFLYHTFCNYWYIFLNISFLIFIFILDIFFLINSYIFRHATFFIHIIFYHIWFSCSHTFFFICFLPINYLVSTMFCNK